MASALWFKSLFIHLVLLLVVVKSQELPAYNVPKWSTEETHRTNFCDLHEAVESGRIERRNALRGLNISVGFFRYQLNQATGGIDPENPDIAMEVLDEIATMAGFTYRNSYGVMDSPTANETWGDVMNWSVHVYDMMGEWFIETVERLATGHALFPEGWYDGNFILIQRHVEEDDDTSYHVSLADLFAWTTPFTPALWGLIAATTIVSGFVYYLLDYFDSRIRCKPMDVTLEESIFYSAFSFNGHYTHQPKSRGTRIVVFSMAFFFLIIVAAYTANLASFLVIRNQPHVLINSIQDAIRHDLTICVQGGSATDEHLQTYRIPQSRIVRGQGPNGAFLELLEGNCDILLGSMGEYETNRRSVVYNPDCAMEYVGRIVKFESAGFVVGDSERHCTSLLRDVLHLFIVELKENPVFDLIWEQYREKQATVSCSIADGDDVGDSESDTDSMGINNLSGMFLLHCCALVLALISTLLRFCWQPNEHKKKMRSDLCSWIRGERALDRASFSAGGRKRLSAFLFNDPKTLRTLEEGANNYLEDNNNHQQQGGEEKQYIMSAKSPSPLENEISKMTSSSSSASSSQCPLLLEVLRKTLEETNLRHREEMEESSKRHRDDIEQSNRRHEEEIKQIHQYYQDELQQSYTEHRRQMEKVLRPETTKQQSTSTAAISSKTLGVYEWRE